MNVWRYQIGGKTEISAPIEYVYTFASDPQLVPKYSPEIVRIVEVKRFSEREGLVKSHLKVAGLSRALLYRYHYGPPTSYSGVQEGWKVLRGYFSFSFKAEGNWTIVSHTKGFQSNIPYLAWIVGFIYFHFLARDGIAEELARLKRLVESHSPSATQFWKSR